MGTRKSVEVLSGADLIAYKANRLVDLAKQQAEVIASNPRKYAECGLAMERPDGKAGPKEVRCFGWADKKYDQEVEFNGATRTLRMCPRSDSHRRLRALMASLGWI